MSTGAMTGADAPSLRALAAQMSQSAGRLDGIRQGIRSRLYSIHWDGPDGANFRRAWDGQHVPMLAHVADGLRHAAVRLLAEADQQEAASGVGGGGGQTIGPATGRIDTHDGNGFLDDLEEGVDASAWVVGGFGALYTGILARYGNDVAGYFRNGTWVDGYHRWNPGRADGLNRWLGTAGDVNRSIGQLDRFGKVLTVAGAAFDGYGQWQEDEGKGYSTEERAARAAGGAAVAGVAGVVAERAGMAAGAAIGTALMPGVGTVIGGVVGWAIASGVTSALEDQLTDLGAWAVSEAFDAAPAVVDFGSDVLEAGGDLLGDIGEGAADLWEDLTPW